MSIFSKIRNWFRTQADMIDQILQLKKYNVGDYLITQPRAMNWDDCTTAIVESNPAHIIKYRFYKQTVQAQLRIKWWGYPLKKIKTAVTTLMSGDTEAFIREHDTRITKDK